jgi:hypothetical protein
MVTTLEDLNMPTTRISVAKDFSPTPAGRYRTDGPYSGEIFRDEFLYPALTQNEQVEVDLDDALGYGSSFLEEAFGGLVRVKKMSPVDLRKKLKIKSTRKFYYERVWKYIKDAEALSPQK